MTKTGLALSIQQPWAWLIVHGYKPVENRSWDTRVRGTVGIHAGKAIDTEGLNWVRHHFPDIPLPDRFDLGGIVGSATLTEVVYRSRSPWFFGPKGFIFAEPKPLPFMPCRGQLGFFKPDLPVATEAQDA